MRDEAIKAQETPRAMKSALIRYLPLLLLALAWEMAPRLGIVSSLALPPLSTVLAAWVDLLSDGELVTNGAGLALSRMHRPARSPS